MTLRFRIKPAAPFHFVVQRKGWFFWRTIQDDYYGISCDKTFDTKDHAKAYIDEKIARSYRDAERAIAINLHLSRPIEEYPA